MALVPILAAVAAFLSGASKIVLVLLGFGFFQAILSFREGLQATRLLQVAIRQIRREEKG